MGYNSTKAYLDLLDDLVEVENIPDGIIPKLTGYVKSIYRSDVQNNYSKPMLWIGIYIALASLLCILAMVADLLHGLRNRKFWIPCKYFIVNATSLTVIAVAMKLPVDLSGAMPGDVDQAAKLGSMAFMCTMMANLLPSLAAMDSKELLTNITALGILVITLVVNVCIQISTGVVSIKEETQRALVVANVKLESVSNRHRNSILATVYVTILLLLLIIHVCSSLAILKSKKIIESKYQRHHDIASKGAGGKLTAEELQQHLRSYWIMAGSGNPQFIAACSITTTASGVICVVSAVLHTLTISWNMKAILKKDYDSDYQWSMPVILRVQFIGVIVGTIAPFFRCFATLSFKVSIKSAISNHIKVLKVERYWSSQLSEWKQGSLPFPFRGHKLEAIIHYSRNGLISLCIQLQEGVVVMCKTIALIPFFIMICVLYCLRCLKPMFRICVKKSKKSEQNKHLRQYVLQLENENENELADRTLEGLLKSMNRLIGKGEKDHPKHLTKLISEKSTRDFPGVKDFDDCSSLDHEQKYHDCWSLPVVTLTTIAVSLPGIGKEQVYSLSKSVGEGLKYVTLVEETLNATDDYASVQKAAETLWPEVYFHRKWLGHKLQKLASTSDQVDKTSQVIKWFNDTANTKKNSCAVDQSKSICLKSMYSITKTILHYQANTDDKENQMQLFDKLSTMIADIMAACFTNLPRVIEIKCHTSATEKRVANTQELARLLGETKEIINTVQERHQPPFINPNDLPFLGKWRADLKNP